MLFSAVIEIFKDLASFFDKDLGMRYPINWVAVLITSLGLVKLGIMFKDSVMCRKTKNTGDNITNLKSDLDQLKSVFDLVETFK